MGGQEHLARRIERYRELAGLSQVELAAEVGIDRTALSKIESGTRRVSALELSELARALDVRMDWFFTDPPEAVVGYRTSASDQTLSSIDEWLERLSREAEFVHRRGRTDWPRLTIFPTNEQSMDPEDLARKARAAAGVGEEPIRSITAFAERLGVLMFSIDLGRDAPDGASTPTGEFGLAIVNGERKVGRRRLAAGHEVGHLICGDQYEVDWRVDDSSQRAWESKLDRFARALLLPAEPLRQSWNGHGSDDLPERARALIDASHWQVDMSTLASRLLELGLIDYGVADRIRGYQHGRADFDELDIVNRTDLDPLALPKRYVKSVLRLYRGEDISADRALDLLLDSYEEADLPELDPLPDGAIWSLL